MTISEIQEKIINEFKNFDNWMDKYNYLVKLGKDLSSIDSKYKTENNLIKGCQVKTWFHSAFKDGKVFYDIDSSSIMIKGIIALLIRVLSGQKPEDIKNADLYFIDKTGLRENFSPARANSLWKLANKMKSDATLREVKIGVEKKGLRDNSGAYFFNIWQIILFRLFLFWPR